MMRTVYGWYSFVANPAVIALLFVGYLLCTVGFSLRSHFLGLANEVPDAHPWYSREELQSLLEHFGPDHRPIYALTECSLDLVFPLIYASLFAGLIAHVYPCRAARWLLAFPLVAMVCDLSENFHFAHLACHFDDFNQQIGSLYWTAVLSTATKFVSFSLATVALLIGAVGRLWNGWSGAV
jgi:hypothetical protein